MTPRLYMASCGRRRSGGGRAASKGWVWRGVDAMTSDGGGEWYVLI